MIPEKKKTAEEIAALREGLGIPPQPAPPAPHPAATSVAQPKAENPPPAEKPAAAGEPVIPIKPLPAPERRRKPAPKPVHTLRKRERPLAPVPADLSVRRTELPAHRHDPRDVAEIRRQEALAALRQQGSDPAAHLRRQTASPFLLVPGYLLAAVAAVAAWQDFHYITPAALIALVSVIMLFIALRKPRSRHHAALLFIAVFLTLVFGALHYAPLFQNAP